MKDKEEPHKYPEGSESRRVQDQTNEEWLAEYDNTEVIGSKLYKPTGK